MRVAITGAAVRSVIGDEVAELGFAVAAQRVGLTKDHAYRDLIDAPLGVLPGLADGAPELARQLAQRLTAQTRLLERYEPHEIGLFLGTTTSGVDGWFKHVTTATRESLLSPRWELGSIAPVLKQALGITGPAFVFATACSAAAVAMAKARDAVAMGLVKAAVAGGFDVLTPMTIMGFDCLQILDHDLCRPFHPERKGLNLAEGGALFAFEAEPTRVAPLAFLSGAGAASDAYHMTHPDPEARGMELAMRRALADAGIEPREIAYVNAHGTGTIPNDHTEKVALDRVFGAGRVAFSSTKGLHGHTLGGAGALEAAICLAMVRDQPWRYVLSNSFGFGGNDASLILEAAR